MGKRKSRKKEQRRKRLKQSVKFEIYGLSLLAFSLLALVQPGLFGQVMSAFFRFFAGSWDFLIPLTMVGLALYMIIKRSWPKQWHYRWYGIAIIVLGILILSHLNFYQDVTGEGRFEDQSVISVTWHLYMEDVTADTPLNVGGGMIGAVAFGILNGLFAQMGTYMIIPFLFVIGFLLILGYSFQEMVDMGKNSIHKMSKWMKERRREWQEMMDKEDDQTQNSSPSAQRKKRKSQKGDKAEEGTASLAGQHDSDPHVDPDPEIYDFTDVAYQQDEMDFPELDQHVQRDSQSNQTGSAQAPELSSASPTAAGQPASQQHQAGSPSAGPKTGDVAGESVQNAANGAHTDEPTGVVTYHENNEHYQLPPFSFLKKQSRSKNIQKQDMKSRARKLEQTLESFGVHAQVTQVHRGPAVTRYEVHPAVGVKVSRIVNLQDDIALALAAKGIRIEAPIPGKSAIGIEVPNEDVSMVTFREVLESSSFHESESKLSIGLGRDISGEPIVAHLNKMPHLLVAGATGSGKSVCINGIIASILYKAKPHEVKLMMIDPKMVELNVYNGIPHLLTPVVTDPKKASMSLKKVVAEMERRYELFAETGTRDIERYNDIIRKENEKNPEEKKPLLPYIVVIIDELADLMMVSPADVEDAIIRIAQMARAAGIHLIIATQRPSVDVITGIIKANIPSRIAFGVSSQTDSRTILDTGGAEKLLGRGDMLFLPVGASKTLRIQGAFISDDEVEKLVEYCIGQQKASYHEEMIPDENDEQSDIQQVEDELYHDALDLVINQGHASVSMLQRRFRIGYTRAARLIDALEANGVVGPYEGSKPREVLISKDESHIS